MYQFIDAVDEAEMTIRCQPSIGSPHLKGTRIWLVNGFPFYLVYLNVFQSIQVVALAHGSRRLGYWRRRIP